MPMPPAGYPAPGQQYAAAPVNTMQDGAGMYYASALNGYGAPVVGSGDSYGAPVASGSMAVVQYPQYAGATPAAQPVYPMSTSQYVSVPRLYAQGVPAEGAAPSAANGLVQGAGMNAHGALPRPSSDYAPSACVRVAERLAPHGTRDDPLPAPGLAALAQYAEAQPGYAPAVGSLVPQATIRYPNSYGQLCSAAPAGCSPPQPAAESAHACRPPLAMAGVAVAGATVTDATYPPAGCEYDAVGARMLTGMHVANAAGAASAHGGGAYPPYDGMRNGPQRKARDPSRPLLLGRISRRHLAGVDDARRRSPPVIGARPRLPLASDLGATARPIGGRRAHEIAPRSRGGVACRDRSGRAACASAGA